jgi:hypothetical protein
LGRGPPSPRLSAFPPRLASALFPPKLRTSAEIEAKPEQPKIRRFPALPTHHIPM